MTRRILLALLALTAAVLVAAVVPLALKATAHDQQSYAYATEQTAHSVAAIAEDTISTGTSSSALHKTLSDYANQGDGVLVLDASGHLIIGRGQLPVPWQRTLAQARAQSEPETQVSKTRVVVAEPIWNDKVHSENPIGMVVLERPTSQLNDITSALWLYLALLGASAMVAAAIIAITFARWVSRPLVTMDSAARRLADGELAVRAGTGSGPPELRRMAATFNMMAGRLETLVHGHRALLADVSHQLRTPLAALRLRIDLLAAESGPTAAAELADAQGEIARLSRLVDGLLAAARAESLTEQRVVVDLVTAAAERVTAWHPVADSADVKLVMDPAGAGTAGAAMVAVGAGHVEQILDNLLANAIEALDAGGRVTVTVSVADGGTRLVVADDGPGMSADERSRAFMRFFTASPNGTGLGLAIVHRLVTSNGGTARLSETPGGGLTVTLEFPASLSQGTPAQP
jgi:signal transduction histidine kinase